MPVITMLNQKGGVGKTSTCHHLAGTLALLGKRVLLLDNDPQASLTQGFWGPVATGQLDPGTTIAALYRGDDPFPDQVIKPSGVAGVDLIAGAKLATDFNVPRPQDAPAAMQTCLRAILDEVRDRYDLVLIDCPPNLHLCSWAALVASDHLVVPLQAEDYGAQGIVAIQESVELVLGGPNPRLSLLGYLITMFNSRLMIHKMYEGLLRNLYGAEVFTTMVPIAADFKEAIAQRLPIAQYKPKGASTKVMKGLAAELQQRLDAVRSPAADADVAGTDQARGAA